MFEKSHFPPNEVIEGWGGLVKGKPAIGGLYVFVAEMLKVDGEVEKVGGEVVLVR